MVEAAKSLFLILSALFPIIDPLGGSPIYLALKLGTKAFTMRQNKLVATEFPELPAADAGRIRAPVCRSRDLFPPRIAISVIGGKDTFFLKKTPCLTSVLSPSK